MSDAPKLQSRGLTWLDLLIVKGLLFLFFKIRSSHFQITTQRGARGEQIRTIQTF